MTTPGNTSELLEKASVLLDSGQATPALEIFKQVIELDPSNAEAWLMKGAISGETGQIDEAFSSINRALQINPTYTDAHLTLGNLQQATGKTADAIKSLQAAAASAPDDPDVHFQLANMLTQTGNYAEAYSHCLKATEFDHKYAEAWHLLGWLQQQLGKPEEAERSYKEAMIIAPENSRLYSDLGMLLVNMGKHQDSIRYLDHYKTVHPDDADTHNTLGAAFMGAGKIGEAEKTLQQALSIDPNHAGAHANLGMVLQYSGQLHKARQHLEKAVAADPNRPEIHYQLAGVLSGLGEYDTASRCCQKAIDLDPTYTNAIAGQADIQQKRGDYKTAFELIRPLLDSRPVNIQAAIIHSSLSKHVENDIDSITLLESITQTGKSTQHDQIQIFNALGKLYDRAGQYEHAFENFSKSNAAKQSNYNPGEHEQLISKIIEKFSADKIISASRVKSTIPIFIIGMPRSGTTLVEQILASHPQVHGGGEFMGIMMQLNQPPEATSPYPHYASELDESITTSMAEKLLDQIKSADSHAARVIINERPSYLFLGLLKCLFPEAKFVHCARDPLDTCLSCYFQLLSNEHDYSYTLEHQGHYYAQYQRLMRHWEKTFGNSIFTVNYEDMVSKQEETTRSLIDYCELNWDDTCLRFHETRRNVVTPSYDDVHQPIYKTSVSRWKNYENFIQPLRSALEVGGQ